MNIITVNGVTYKTSGSGITINNGSVMVGSETIVDGISGIVEVKFEGDLASLTCDCSATINGNVEGDVDAGNNVKCGDVKGSIDAGNSIKCKDVYGTKMKAGNSIKCENKR